MSRILVIQYKMIGDVLVTSILCENLKIAYPHAQIDYLVYESTLPVLMHNDENYHIIPFTDKQRNSKLELFKFAQQLRKNNYDIIIDAYSKLESWAVVAMSNAHTKISFKKGYIDFLYTHCIERHQIPTSNLGLTIEQRLNLLTPLGISSPNIKTPTLKVSPQEKEQADQFLKLHNVNKNIPLVMVSVLGSSLDKTYPLHYTAKILDEMIQFRPMSLLFNYIPNQLKEADELYNMCNSETQKHIYFEAIGKSLRDFISLMNECDFIIGNDGGAINMAKALDKPSFTIFSPMIQKEGWNSFEDGKKYISVHLNDYLPKLFENISKKELKNKNEQLYLNFKPELFKDLLLHFLKENA